MPEGRAVSYQKNGAAAGISTFMEHLAGGVDFAVLFNGSPGGDEDDSGQRETNDKRQGPPYLEIKAAIEKTTSWPKHDLFGKYR